MKRRQFIRNAMISTAGTLAFPYILPSGIVSAQTTPAFAEHVVFVLFAGGVRHQESVGKRYLADSQNIYADDDLNIEGNILSNMLEGAAPERKIAYGVTAEGETEGGQAIPRILGETLQQQGTLFQEARVNTTAHFSGQSSLLSGNYKVTQGLRDRPFNPTIFEYLRRHKGLKATDTWFVGNGIGNSTNLLNYSANQEYGAQHGANFLAPGLTFSSTGEQFLAHAKDYHQDERAAIIEMRDFLNKSFLTTGNAIPGIKNTEEERRNIKDFMDDIFSRKNGIGSPLRMPPVVNSGDAITIGYACEILEWFKPKMLAVNMFGADACHSNFTDYLKALHSADHAVGHLWNFIQSIPEMTGNTMLIIAPEHGRNLEPNILQDLNDWYAYDHSDQNALRNWCLMVGPQIEAGRVIGSEGNPVGNTAQCTLTIAEAMGIKQDVINAGLLFNNQSFFDLM